MCATVVRVHKIPMRGDPVEVSVTLACPKHQVLAGVRNHLASTALWPFEDIDFHDISEKREGIKYTVTSLFYNDVRREYGDSGSVGNEWLKGSKIWHTGDVYVVTTTHKKTERGTLASRPAPLVPMQKLVEYLNCFSTTKAALHNLVSSMESFYFVNGAERMVDIGPVIYTYPSIFEPAEAAVEVDVLRRAPRAARSLRVHDADDATAITLRYEMARMITRTLKYFPYAAYEKQRGPQETTMECDICLDDVPTSKFLPLCGGTCSKSTCSACVAKIYKLKASIRKCPFCRGKLLKK